MIGVGVGVDVDFFGLPLPLVDCCLGLGCGLGLSLMFEAVLLEVLMQLEQARQFLQVDVVWCLLSLDSVLERSLFWRGVAGLLSFPVKGLEG